MATTMEDPTDIWDMELMDANPEELSAAEGGLLVAREGGRGMTMVLEWERCEGSGGAGRRGGIFKLTSCGSAVSVSSESEGMCRL